MTIFILQKKLFHMGQYTLETQQSLLLLKVLVIRSGSSNADI